MSIDIKINGVGPQPAKILIIGEAPGKDEMIELKPFVGKAGQELTRMLHEAGIIRADCRVTNVCKYRPPGNKIEAWWAQKKKDIQPNYIAVDGQHFDPRIVEGLRELDEEIAATDPHIIIPLGNLALWATTRNRGITKWRSSLLRGVHGRNVLPTIHPAAVLRQWDWRYLVVHDLRRAARWSNQREYPVVVERFTISPTFEQCTEILRDLIAKVELGELKLSCDIETKCRHLAVFGIAWSEFDALCIPLMCQNGTHYWTLEQEVAIVLLLRRLLTHKNCYGIGQNWQYDYQYVAKYWGFEVNMQMDCMSEHHAQLPGTPKGLDFLSSLYADIHVYWKDEGKEQGSGDDIQWWTYNCRDCVRTFEVHNVLLRNRRADIPRVDGLTAYETQQALTNPIARASARGVKRDHALAAKMVFVLQNDIYEAEQWLNRILGHEFNCRSNPQMARLFYEELGQTKILDRKTKRPTLNDEALTVIGKRDILLRPLTEGIKRVRSLSNFLSVCTQPTDSDGRIRCQYTIPGTETFRLASSSDPFGFGSNLQNVSTGERSELANYTPPNLRRIFLPDTNFTIGEFDLPQADARVVAWEAEDESLIELFEDPTRHLHMENAVVLYNRKVEKSTKEYYYAKQGVHLTNYGGSDRVLAMTLGMTVHEADQFQKKWFSAHPKIKEWHTRIHRQLMVHRWVENKFGYRRYYFDRVEELLKEALAWIPQSTVGIATNRAILKIEADPICRKLPMHLLLQTHDSSTLQWPTVYNSWVTSELPKRMSVVVPYAYPLVLTPECKISNVSWGDCQAVKIK